MDATSEERLSHVMPELAARVRKMADQLAEESITIRVTQGLRTWAEQDALYAQGRTEAGRVVTNAKGGESWHNYGAAVDVAPFDEGIPDWNLSHPAWKRIVEVGTLMGLVSGTAWKDTPHFELTGRFPATPTHEIKQLHAQGEVQAVWNAINDVRAA